MESLNLKTIKNPFRNYKFKASSVGNLMVEPRSKSELLSETTINYLSEVFLELFYGRKKELEGDSVIKGVEKEGEAIQIVSYFVGQDLIKNENIYNNDYFVGIPDIITEGWVADIKVADSIFTFPKFKFIPKENGKSFFDDSRYRNYYWQLQVYMDLVGLNEARLFYVLVNNPDWYLAKLEKFKMYEFIDRGFDGLDLEIEMERYRNVLRFNYLYDDLPLDDRVYEVKVSKDEEGLKVLKNKIDYIRSGFWEDYRLS